jgi:hypothetical protein
MNVCDYCNKEVEKTYSITERDNEMNFVAKKRICIKCCEPKIK